MYSDLFIVITQILAAPGWFLPTVAVAYLIGSIPFGLLLTRFAGLGDVRKIGSGNIGTTNVLRTGRKDLAAATLVLDAGKGAVAVLLADHFLGVNGAVLAGIAAFMGHLFPIFLGFRGGKGVATFLGIALAMHPLVGAAACATWVLVAVIFRYSSLAALACAALTPVYAIYWYDHLRMELAILLAAFIFMKHRANIARLLKGEEPRIGAK